VFFLHLGEWPLKHNGCERIGSLGRSSVRDDAIDMQGGPPASLSGAKGGQLLTPPILRNENAVSPGALVPDRAPLHHPILRVCDVFPRLSHRQVCKRHGPTVNCMLPRIVCCFQVLYTLEQISVSGSMPRCLNSSWDLNGQGDQTCSHER
jgi:hypothetical protein